MSRAENLHYLHFHFNVYLFSIKYSGIPSRESKPKVNSDKVQLKIGSFDELTSSQAPPQICSNLQARSHGSSKSISSIEEPIYVNAMIYKTMDEVIAETGHDTGMLQYSIKFITVNI